MKRIIFLTTDWSSEIAQKIYAAIYDAEKMLDFSIDIFSCFGGLVEEGNVIGEYDVYKLPDFKRYDGAVIMASQIHADTARERVIALARNANLPIVSINVPLDNTIQVGTDNYHSFCQMVEHVVSVHHAQKILYVDGPKGYEADIRKQAFTDVCGRYDLLDSISFEKGDWTMRSGITIAERLCRHPDPLPDAIICANDDMAIGVAQFLVSSGVRVPEDVIITGFDDSENSRIFSPSITTVSRDYNRMIMDALENVIAEIDHQPHQSVLFSDHQLLIRESCGCKAHSDEDVKTFRRNYTSLSMHLSAVEVELDRMNAEFFSAETVYDLFQSVERYLSVFDIENLYVFIHHSYLTSLLEGDQVMNHDSNHLVDLVVCNDNRVMMDEKLHVYQSFDAKELVPQDIHDSARIWLFYPIHFMEEPIGYVALKDFPPAVVRRQIRRPLSYFAMAMDNLRKKIRLEKLNKALGEKADRDPLTGLFNRYGFTEHALPVKEQVLEAGGLLEFLFIDVDDMRKINDEFGHGAGDQALMTLSKAMMDLAYKNKYNEKNFIAMRFGGDEFTVLCEKKDESFAALIKKEVGKMNMLRQYPFDIKVSIGVLEISPIDDFTADQMLKIADDRMYEEKQKKKNGDK